MTIAIIAAIAANRVIGADGKLPWHISDDLKRFKRLTIGHTVLMGRRTFESLGKPLPNRRNIVLSSRPIPDVECYATIDAALAAIASDERVFIIGGGEIYRQFLTLADELYLTLVDLSPAGETLFPEYTLIVKNQFRLIQRDPHPGFVFEDYIRVTPAGH